MTYFEKELCGLSPVPVEEPSEDELGARAALPKKRTGYVPVEEVSGEMVVHRAPDYWR